MSESDSDLVRRGERAGNGGPVEVPDSLYSPQAVVPPAAFGFGSATASLEMLKGSNQMV